MKIIINLIYFYIKFQIFIFYYDIIIFYCNYILYIFYTILNLLHLRFHLTLIL